jgi:hypothetical protein
MSKLQPSSPVVPLNSTGRAPLILDAKGTVEKMRMEEGRYKPKNPYTDLMGLKLGTTPETLTGKATGKGRRRKNKRKTKKLRRRKGRSPSS